MYNVFFNKFKGGPKDLNLKMQIIFNLDKFAILYKFLIIERKDSVFS